LDHPENQNKPTLLSVGKLKVFLILTNPQMSGILISDHSQKFYF